MDILEKIEYGAFYDIKAKRLKEMFGVEDRKTSNRIVLKRLIELGVPIYRRKYIFMEELAKAIRGDCNCNYVPQGEAAKKFLKEI